MQAWHACCYSHTEQHLQGSFALFRDRALQQGSYWEEELTVIGKGSCWAQLQAWHLQGPPVSDKGLNPCTVATCRQDVDIQTLSHACACIFTELDREGVAVRLCKHVYSLQTESSKPPILSTIINDGQCTGRTSKMARRIARAGRRVAEPRCNTSIILWKATLANLQAKATG